MYPPFHFYINFSPTQAPHGKLLHVPLSRRVRLKKAQRLAVSSPVAGLAIDKSFLDAEQWYTAPKNTGGHQLSML
jgi:hypothetical protein